MATVARRSDYVDPNDRHSEDADHSGLPRFQLPNETVDPLDAARTVERPALRNLVRQRPTLRKRVAREPEEIAPEDILMEVYADGPPASRPPASVPPPLPRRSPEPPITERLPMSSGPSNAYFATEMLGTPLPAQAHPHHPHPVDALMAIPPPPPSPMPYSMAPNSVAPVVYGPPNATSVPTPVYEIRPPPAASSGRALWVVALVGLGILAGIAVAISVPRGTFSRRASAKQATPPPSVTIVVAPPPAAPTVVPPVASVPTMSVDALPKPAIDANMTLITFPPSAVGHRIYIDHAILMNGPAQAMVKCGKHKIRIGSEGKARKVDCPCGGEVVLE